MKHSGGMTSSVVVLMGALSVAGSAHAAATIGADVDAFSFDVHVQIQARLQEEY